MDQNKEYKVILRSVDNLLSPEEKKEFEDNGWELAPSDTFVPNNVSNEPAVSGPTHRYIYWKDKKQESSGF